MNNKIFTITAVITAIASVIITFTIVTGRYFNLSVILPFFTVIVALFFLFALYIYRSKPSTVNISILGFPQSGKTVFLTMLYYFINTQKSINEILFIPKGRESIEKVAENMTLLQKGEWLPRTTIANPVFFFRAIAVLKRVFFNSKYLIEIGDFAGEETQNISEYDKKWLHKNEYFKYVIYSDIIWLAFDCSILKDYEDRVECENKFISALQMIMDEKGVKIEKKMRTPVCLLFLKADINNYYEYPKDLLLQVGHLYNFCTKHFECFNYFAISSVGKVYEDVPPKEMEPINVEKPLIWSLKNMRNVHVNTSHSTLRKGEINNIEYF